MALGEKAERYGASIAEDAIRALKEGQVMYLRQVEQHILNSVDYMPNAVVSGFLKRMSQSVDSDEVVTVNLSDGDMMFVHRDHSSAVLVETTQSKATSPPERAAKAARPSADRAFTPYNAAPDEKYMNQSQRDHFASILTSWESTLVQEAGEVALEPGSSSAERLEQLRDLSSKIRHCLEALGRGTYGYCESCKSEIGIRRLEARPTSTLCADCRALEELKPKI